LSFGMLFRVVSSSGLRCAFCCSLVFNIGIR
jgi:hypothetical protein